MSSNYRKSGGTDFYIDASSNEIHPVYNTRGEINILRRILFGLIFILLFTGLGILICDRHVKITLNEAEVILGGKKTIADAISEQDLSPVPGNLIDVEGIIITKGDGERLSATVNGEYTTDTSRKLHNGDTVTISDGEDIMEEHTTVTKAIPVSLEYTSEGWGTIHLYEGDGTDGEKEIVTGQLSGKTVETVIKEPGDIIRKNVYADTGDDMVIALTFDDGPWPETTAEILDILAEYNAKATFFTIGNQITETEYGPPLIEREQAEGHQICTHTYDHAEGSGEGVSLDLMSHEEQIEEITKGYEAIESVTGKTPSTVIRAPGGNFNDDTAENLYPYITAEIYWDVDTRDWSIPGVDYIVQQIESAWSGSVILMHDGGGDRSQTVEALKEALPYLISEGYSFVTIDELLTYDLVYEY